jgi:hypothetical protein
VKTSDLLREWAWTRRRHEAWLAMFSTDPAHALIACCTALASPQSPRELFTALVDGGEFEAAELLLLDERFCAELGADLLASLAAQIEWAKRTTRAAIEIRLAHLSARTEACGLTIDAAAIRRAAEQRGADATDRLQAAETSVQAAEAARVLALRERLAATPSTLAVEEFASWRTAVERAIDSGSLAEAEAALSAGPSADRPPSIDVPTRPLWSFGKHTLAEVLGWFLEHEPSPPWFARHSPPRTDTIAWQMIAAVRGWCETRGERERELLLRAFAAVMESKVLGVTRSEALGRIIRVDAPSAPGFHAFAARRWPDGLTVGLADDALLILLGEDVLELALRDVLAAVNDADRRASLLAALGRQLPLAAAFVSTLADEGVRWERHDLPHDLLARDRVVVLVSAPGMGKTTLLRELAASHPTAKIVDASPGVELPEAPVLLVDAADLLDVAALRGLLLEAQWARTTREPAPAILVAGRPELIAKLSVPASVVAVERLPPRSAASMREQARVTLAWVGVDATRPGLYDRMAWLASGNPTLLFLLCRAVALALAARGPSTRRLDDAALDQAWASDELLHSARRLLFEPLQATAHSQAVLRVIAELAGPGEVIERDLVLWAMRQVDPLRDHAWLMGHVQLLVDYGLLHAGDRGIGLAAGGVTQLICRWCAEPDL